ncbi:MAG: hypothetical protein HY926_08190 [Elusimicrobia bacterium]|nr:hypothetical protein [Elusimicrobiota bacterium]
MTITRWLAVAGATAAAVLPALRRLSDPDLPWHLAVGRAAVASRGLLKGDEFSYTQAGRAVPYEYVSELVLYLTQRLAGFWGLHILAAAAIGLLAWLMVLRAGKECRPLALAFSALALAALSPFLILRPALLGLPCFAAALLLIDRYRQDGEAHRLWLLVPLQLLWANVHAFAVVGAGLAVLAAVLLAKGKHRLPPLLAAAATCLSSFGPGIFLGPWRVAGHERFLAEWAPASFELFWGYDPALGLLVLLTACACLWGRSEDGEPALPLFDLLALCGTFALMLLRFRLAPLFILLAAPWAAARLWPALKDRRWLPRAVLAAALVSPALIALRREVPWGLGFDPGRLPEGAVRFLAEKKLQGPVFNDIAFGGYLIWRLGPQARVFIDGRTAYLYPPDFLREAWQAQYRKEAFSQLSRRHGFQWAVVNARPDSAAAAPLAASPEWAMLYIDDAAAVYVNVNGPNGRLRRSGYQGLRHLTPPALLFAEDLPLPVLEHDAALALAQAPGSLRARLWSQAAALRQGRTITDK